jgi:perosamine synthetase
LRNLCFGAERRFVHEALGWNFRMSNLQAAVGVAQLERLAETLRRKRQIGAWYDELLAGLDGLERQPARTAYAERLPWVYGVVLRDDAGFDAEAAMRRLAVAGIGTRPFFWPMHEQPALRRLGLLEGVRRPVAERIARRGFYLPSGVALSRDQAERVAGEVRRLFE